ncbi:hypothetical protein ACS0TY_019452 [Phlomoides rotata]
MSENLFLRCSSSLFILLLISLLQTSLAINNPHICSPSSCGNILNISFPFRLKHDPKHCGDPKYELSCKNNVTFLHLHSQAYDPESITYPFRPKYDPKYELYKVKAINYDNFTIRLVDVSINNNTCSVPDHSLYPYNFSDGYPYSIGKYRDFLTISQDFPDIAWPINYMSCPYSLSNSSFFTETNDCVLNSSNSRHTYIKVGHMNASDVRYKCRVDQILMTSWKFEDLRNISLSEIHHSLLYGFELSWIRYPCSKCKVTSSCELDKDHTAICAVEVVIPWILIVATVVFFNIIAILGCVCLGVSIPGKIIVGFASIFCGILYICGHEWIFNHFRVAMYLMSFLGYFIVLILVVRFIIGFPFLMGYAIYIYRRRHLSMFDVIEKFLRSDDKLMPIRYSYSDIKKITRDFREKLGQGGFGTVYKGKLRSGSDVAVKLLKDTRDIGQDFINEISTIGRIHHVNVARLVGYCAVRSKRALVYDFMSNGSLDKYIFSQEKMNSLTWERKHEIAIGVARGIEYLHKGCEIQILHFDIKPHNILLDDNFTPKISDFGLAKFCSTEKNMVTMSAARGTIGYVAPELINRGFGEVSNKADVYSFGMLLIDMVGLKKDLRGDDHSSSQYFPCWIYKYFEQGKELEIGETDENNDDNNDTNRKIAKKMTIVALWCIQMCPSDRPSMNKVLEMLEARVEQLRVPNRPPQSAQVEANDEDQSYNTYSTDSISFLYNDDASSIEITVVND